MMVSPERIVREMLARGQATGARRETPAPPAPAFVAGGIRESAFTRAVEGATSRELRQWRAGFAKRWPDAPMPHAALPVRGIDGASE
ncbi:hypothetical protein [Xanthobacter autotrophicus]|uniref:hypothetical protein n=1 Tax=Xanthobacter autotrophicus TaxID=280 RepID=UPI003729677A